ncbi:hypothetical protein TsFJ059_010108 [Trichoderma semiorbis]|uniref:NACHT domain-containing protein n=1 Tax=Trichoderma semiorbis TaxID=1491008 RepID=A0A9P8HN43_9HYPO|nr:hypothetical protein TsFJ059_010108 [Trichoderma semiorbis]
MRKLRKILGGKASSRESIVASTSSSAASGTKASGTKASGIKAPNSKADASSTSNGKADASSTVESEVAKAPVNPSETICPSEAIWNSAYDALKADEPKLVQAYEKILSLKLRNTVSLEPTTPEGSLEPTTLKPASVNTANTIEKDNVLLRREQMHQLIDNGLNKTFREASIKNSIGPVMQVVNTTKKLVSDAIKDMPQAALPWVIVYISLSYIGITIKWYWEQASLLFNNSSSDHSFIGVQNELQKAFISFYKKLLQFQMKSICNYYRNRGFVFLRDLVELDNWDSSLKSIQTDDTSLRNKIGAFLNLESESHLRAIAHHTKAQETYQRTQEDQQCLRDLRITDPRADRTRIENTKGGLLQESYRWILENPQFQTWRSSDDNRLLWLRGDPGKGKTMLLCGLAQELMQQANRSLVTFFFCQATIPSVNNHIAVLRGLIWLLADQQPSLISYIRKLYDTAGKGLFDEGNSWYTLSEIFSNMLRDEELPPVYIIIDALDECITGRTELLHLIRDVATSSKAKWAVSSRNWPEIEERLSEGMNLSLEVNATLVSSAVDAYISYKASQISLLKHDDNLKEEVCRQMREKANGTFLWVAIVFERLNSQSSAYYDDTSDAMAILNEMPEDLTKLYTVMLARISQLKGKGPELCRTILAIATSAYRPLHLTELSTLAGFQSNLKKLPQLNMLIKDCGSFLTVRENHIYFVHQSAKEYLASDLSSQSVKFRDGMGEIKYNMVLNSLNTMVHSLRENIYGLEHPGIPLEDVSPPDPNPLEHCLYSCTSWMGHLCEIYDVTDSQSLLILEEEILLFLKGHTLHWLEVLALTRNLSTNITYVQRLNELLKKRSAAEELQKSIYDASRFMQYNTQIMEAAPMQIYSSPLLFSPSQSLIVTRFDPKLSWVKHIRNSVKESYWSPRLQIIANIEPEEMCSSGTNLLVLCSSSKNVQIWDMATGRQAHVLNHAEDVQHAVFSSDLNRVLTIAHDRYYCWDANSGVLIQNVRIRGHNEEWAYSVSNNGKFMASCKGFALDEDCIVHIYHMSDGTKLQLPFTAVGHSRAVLRWSNDSSVLAVTTGYTTCIWEVPSGKEKLGLDNHDGTIRGMPSLSGDSKLIAFPVGEGFEVWNLHTEEKILNIRTESSWEVEIVEFSKDSRLIAETRYGKDSNGFSHYNILTWEIATGMKQHELRTGHRDITGITWSDDGQTLAVAFSDDIELYDLTKHTYWDFNGDDQPSSSQTGRARDLIAFSPDFELLATPDRYVAIWDTRTGNTVQAFDKVNTHHISKLQFSQDAKSIYTYSRIDGLQKWDIASDSLIHTFPTSPAKGRKNGIAFSFGENFFASESEAGDEMLLWNLNKAEEVSHSMTYEKGLENMHLLALSKNAKYLVSAEYLASAKYIHYVSESTTYSFTIWDVETNKKLWAINADINIYKGIILCGSCELMSEGRESIVISNDGNTVLLTERARHGMWILTKGGEKTRIKICCRYFDPCFDMESSDTHVLLQLGRIALDNLIAQAKNLTGPRSAYDYDSIVEGYGVSLDKSWIIWNGKKVLWLPPDYRVTKWMARSRHCIVMANSSRDYPCILRFFGPPPFVKPS